MDHTTGMNGASADLSEQQHFGIFVIYLKDKTPWTEDVIILIWAIGPTLGQVWVQHLEGVLDADQEATLWCDRLLPKSVSNLTFLPPSHCTTQSELFETQM